MKDEQPDLVSQLEYLHRFLSELRQDNILLRSALFRNGIWREGDSTQTLSVFLTELGKRWQALIFSELPERHADILSRHYCFTSPIHPTLKELGLEYDITAERVRQLEAIGLSRLRRGKKGEVFLQIALEVATKIVS